MIEVGVSIYLYALLSLTDLVRENAFRDEIGWFLVSLTGSIVAINILVFIWRSICIAVAYFKRKFPKLFKLKARKS